MTSKPDPMKTAAAMWQQLIDYHPAVAAALLRQLRAMPEDWPLRLFGVGRADAALDLEPRTAMLPEIAPWSDDWEDCPACGIHGLDCRWHDGFDAGHEPLMRSLLEAVKVDKAVTVSEFLQRSADADEAADRGVTVPDDASGAS